MSAATSAANPPVLGASWDTTSLPVFLTDRLTVSKSHGRIVLSFFGMARVGTGTTSKRNAGTVDAMCQTNEWVVYAEIRQRRLCRIRGNFGRTTGIQQCLLSGSQGGMHVTSWPSVPHRRFRTNKAHCEARNCCFQATLTVSIGNIDVGDARQRRSLPVYIQQYSRVKQNALSMASTRAPRKADNPPGRASPLTGGR